MPSPIISQTADATIGFVAENTQKRVSLVAPPNVSKQSSSLSRATATWHAGVAPLSTRARAVERSSSIVLTVRSLLPRRNLPPHGRHHDGRGPGNRGWHIGARDRDVFRGAVSEPVDPDRRGSIARRDPPTAVDRTLRGSRREDHVDGRTLH